MHRPAIDAADGPSRRSPRPCVPDDGPGRIVRSPRGPVQRRSWRADPTSCGSPTSRTWRRGSALPTWPSSSTCSRGPSLAGACRTRFEATWRSMRSSKPCTTAPAKPGAPQRSRRAIPVDSLHGPPARGGHRASVGSVGDSYDNALAERSSVCSRPKSSAPRPLAQLERSSSPRSNGSTGSTTAACSSQSGTFPRRNSKRCTTKETNDRPWWPESTKRVSGIPGPIHWLWKLPC